MNAMNGFPSEVPRRRRNVPLSQWLTWLVWALLLATMTISQWTYARQKETIANLQKSAEQWQTVALQWRQVAEGWQKVAETYSKPPAPAAPAPAARRRR